jgi:hypothetical protein
MIRKAAGLLLLAAAILIPGCSRGPHFKPGCYLNRAVDAGTRRQLEAAAERFYDLVRSGKYEEAWSEASKQFQTRMDREQAAQVWTSMVQTLTIPRDLATNEVAVAVFPPGTRGPQELQCSDPADTTGGRRMLTTDQPIQGYLIQSAQRGSTVFNYASIWFYEGGAWRLGAAGAKPNTFMGRDWRYYRQLAQDQKARDNQRNAALLYNVAMDLLVPAPWVRPDQLEQLEREQKKVVANDLPRGRPRDWVAADSTVFHPYQIGYDITAQGFALKLSYEVPADADTARVAQQAPRLAEFIRASFPEFGEVFSTIWLRATTEVDHQPVWEGTFPVSREP